MTQRIEEYKYKKVEEHKDKQTEDLKLFSGQFQLLEDEKEGIFRIDSLNKPYENFKRYIVFNLFANLISRIENNTQIRKYRKVDIQNIVKILKTHNNRSVSSLKEKIKNKLAEPPGLLKQFKRLFHGFPGDEKLPDRILAALEEGEYQNVQFAMHYFNIDLDNILLLSYKIRESIPRRNKVMKIINREPITFGIDTICANRYLIFTFYNFAIQQIKTQNEINENVKNCLVKILDIICTNFYRPITTSMLETLFENEIINTNKNIEKELTIIAADKLIVLPEEEENLIKKEQKLIQFREDLENILSPLRNLTKSALIHAQKSRIQLAMMNFEFEKQPNLFHFFKIKFNVVNLQKNPELALKHLEWCRQFPTVIVPHKNKEPIQVGINIEKDSQREMKTTIV